ncbi:MAG: DNA repair protein RecN [Alphaproteobacteria bacterium]|nr:DNA repair protein RecN [Alphaproteobacteria bacterium]
MLTRLLINNVVLIEKLELDFSKGLTVFSGETGAGKSILLDSLGFVLGSRADTNLIKKGADKLCVTATFEISDKSSPFYTICHENELEIDDEIIIRRTLSSDGKSKIFICDQPIGLKLLKQLSAYLVEINGQFDNQGLLNSSTHIDFLDAFGGYQKELQDVRQAYEAYQTIQKKLNEISSAYQNALLQEETLKHYLSELEAVCPKKGEEDILNKKRREMMASEKILENLQTAYQALQGQGLANNIRHAITALDKANHLADGKFDNLCQALDTALIELDEATSQIEAASANISYDQNQINTLEERLFTLKDLARKHRCNIDDLQSVLEKITTDLNLIEKNGDELAKLGRQSETLKRDYISKAEILHNCRLKAAEDLSAKIISELKFLKMEKASFRATVTKTNDNLFSNKGFDNVLFEVSTNADTNFGALNKIVSGGELARFMLAVKVNLALKGAIETLIFDEIDAGLSGAAAEAVGSRLFKLAQGIQVFVVTHSPQVASFSQTHFKVSKQTIENTTTTSVLKLSEMQKKEEIARMLSGEIISNEARAAAEKLICKTA